MVFLAVHEMGSRTVFVGKIALVLNPSFEVSKCQLVLFGTPLTTLSLLLLLLLLFAFSMPCGVLLVKSIHRVTLNYDIVCYKKKL